MVFVPRLYATLSFTAVSIVPLAAAFVRPAECRAMMVAAEGVDPSQESTVRIRGREFRVRLTLNYAVSEPGDGSPALGAVTSREIRAQITAVDGEPIGTLSSVWVTLSGTGGSSRVRLWPQLQEGEGDDQRTLLGRVTRGFDVGLAYRASVTVNKSQRSVRVSFSDLTWAQPQVSEVRRDPCQWPFAASSIWNTPIGSGAVYVPARIAPATAAGMTYDPDFIVMTPTEPLVSIFGSQAGFSGQDRCAADGPELFQAPIPADFVVPSDSGNACFAVLMPDGRTVRQAQPLARCAVGGYATAQYEADSNDLFGDGRLGAHGGSAMTALGGTLRVGELRPGKHPPRHVLKGNVYAARNLFRCKTDDACFRWPADRGDGYAVGEYGTLRKNISRAMRMGALLALPPNVDIDRLALQTEPARQLAWTLQNYGMYIVDDTAWEVWAMAIEEGPQRSFSAQFAGDWGFEFDDPTTTSPWASDMRTLFTALSVVNNNSPTSVGGGGIPRVVPPPPIATSCGSGVGASDSLTTPLRAAFAAAVSPACGLADIARIGGDERDPGGPDNQLSVDDMIVFVKAFIDTTNCPGTPGVRCSPADVTDIGNTGAGPDGVLSVDDYLAFMNAFAVGC